MYKAIKNIIIFLFVILNISSSISFSANLENGINLYNQERFNKAFPILEKEARTGNSEAQYYIGKMYDFGQGTKKNIKKAFHWYSKSAVQGNSNAQNNLGYMYLHGEGIERDEKKAYELYLKAALKGNDAAQYNLALFYSKGGVIRQDNIKALYWFRKSADQGYIKALNAMGVIYQFGKGVPINKREAIQWYKKAAEKGDTRSMYNLASIYLPEDNPNDAARWDEVHKWYTLGMQHGDKKDAPFGMGLIYLLGRGNYPCDYMKASNLFNMAAKNGKMDAWYWLGIMEENGYGRPVNKDKALELYRKAAEAGSEPAIRRLNQKESDQSIMKTLKDFLLPQ